MIDVEQLLSDISETLHSLRGCVKGPEVREVDGLLERIKAVGLEKHLVQLGELDWTLLHPVRCRRNLMCDVHEAIDAWFREGGRAQPIGRYTVERTRDGLSYTWIEEDG